MSPGPPFIFCILYPKSGPVDRRPNSPYASGSLSFNWLNWWLWSLSVSRVSSRFLPTEANLAEIWWLAFDRWVVKPWTKLGIIIERTGRRHGRHAFYEIEKSLVNPFMFNTISKIRRVCLPEIIAACNSTHVQICVTPKFQVKSGDFRSRFMR